MDKNNYHCPQFDILTIDENCNVLTCCGDSHIYVKIYNAKKAEEIMQQLDYIKEWGGKFILPIPEISI